MALLALTPQLALAQAGQNVVTQPGKANSGDASSTITSSTLFQLVFSSTANPSSGGTSGSRVGCLLLNNSTDRQWVYFQGPGLPAPTSGTFTATKAKSIPLEAAAATNGQGGWVSCGTLTGVALQDAIWIAGTANDTFVAKQQ